MQSRQIPISMSAARASSGDFVSRALEVVSTLPYRFPTKTNSLHHFPVDEVNAFAASTRPIMAASTAKLLSDFLAEKQARGTAVERALYAGMTEVQLVSRLLSKRPLMFMNPDDSYLLRDGRKGRGRFEAIGTDAEAPPLTLQSLHYYDEMCLYALLVVSSTTHFINVGARDVLLCFPVLSSGDCVVLRSVALSFSEVW